MRSSVDTKAAGCQTSYRLTFIRILSLSLSAPPVFVCLLLIVISSAPVVVLLFFFWRFNWPRCRAAKANPRDGDCGLQRPLQILPVQHSSPTNGLETGCFSRCPGFTFITVSPHSAQAPLSVCVCMCVCVCGRARYPHPSFPSRYVGLVDEWANTHTAPGAVTSSPVRCSLESVSLRLCVHVC